MRHLRLGSAMATAGSFLLLVGVLWAAGSATAVASAAADEPKQKADNTIPVQLAEPVKPQTFPRPIRFHIEAVIDRLGNPQPLLVYKPSGGVFLDREPTAIVRQAFEDSLRPACLHRTRPRPITC